MPDKMPNEAYIWDITNPNAPINVLESPSPITCLKFNTKSVGVIAGGCYNGLVLQWDLRMKGKAINHTQACDVELAHQDPVTDLVWQSGKTGTKFVTTSTDGNVYFWDFKKSDEPIPYYEQCTLTEPPYLDETGGQKGETVCGGTVIAFDINAGPTKFLIGTELGSVCQVNHRAKKPVEIMSRFGLEGGRHLGPIYQCQRNPDSSMFHYFLTVGDWTAQIWHDELKTPIMRTKFHNSYLSDGCWSPTRQGVFFVITKDGWIKVWDYFYRQNELAFEHKVSDCAL
jgi:dynein intermediate chain 2